MTCEICPDAENCEGSHCPERNPEDLEEGE
jgi:hypothetical protein